MNNTLDGIATIRACQNEFVLTREFNMHYDYYTKAYFCLVAVNTWLAVSLDAVVTFYTVFVVYFFIGLRGQ